MGHTAFRVQRQFSISESRQFDNEHLFHSVLLGGRNRALARHIAAHARFVLPKYTFHHDLADIPKELAGQHRRNPVNLPRRHGVQIELPPTIRWHYDQWGWSDHGEVGRAPQVDTLIAALAGPPVAGPTGRRHSRHERPPSDHPRRRPHRPTAPAP